MYKILIKPFFFFFSPEVAHRLAMHFLRLSLKIPRIGFLLRKQFQLKDTQLKREILGLKFENPVGLAAGFDKDGKYLDILPALGFGFLEIGTVTPKPQGGNPQPRLFRLPKNNALINRMGFNNEGVDALVSRLKNYKKNKIIIGGNIGKNKITSNEEAQNDYTYCFEKLFPWVDYFVVNVSSPNTPGLRSLQEKKPLTQLLTTLQGLNKIKEKPKPILLKIAPDLTNEQLDDILSIVQNTKIEGIIATNTTINREKLKENTDKIGAGGLSGQPLRQRATAVIRYLRKNGHKELVIIGVGGIASAEDAIEKLEVGADLVQVFTALVYEGPGLIKRINQRILSSKN